MPKTSGIVGVVAQSGEVVNLADAYKDQRFNQSVDQETGYRTKSLLCAPILDDSCRIVGVLQMTNKVINGGTFNQTDISQ